jgi:hypothetical protein
MSASLLVSFALFEDLCPKEHLLSTDVYFLGNKQGRRGSLYYVAPTVYSSASLKTCDLPCDWNAVFLGLLELKGCWKDVKIEAEIR